MNYADSFNAVTDTILIQITGSLVGILSIIVVRLIDRWLPPMDHKHKRNRRVKEEDVD